MKAGSVMKKMRTIAPWTGVALVAVLAYACYRIVWGHPFKINQLSNRQALFYLMDNPEPFTSLGIADGSILDHHSGRLTAVGNPKRDHNYAELRRDIDE